MPHDIDTPSPWVVRWAPRIASGTVLDVACGGGRHARLFAQRGLQVVAVDRESQTIPGVRFVQSDLEDGNPWPFTGEQFAGIVVTNYLHRPLFAHLLASLARGGVLIYETFALGNERYGKPSNPEFLLRPGELLQVFGSLNVLGFEEGLQEHPKPSCIQRICAVKAVSDNI